MKRARSNQEIVEEFFNNRPFSTPPDADLKRRIRNMLAELVRTLKLGKASAGQQSDAGRLIEALTNRHRGRPRLLRTSRSGFTSSVDWIAAEHHANGSAKPFEMALKDVRILEIEESGAAPSDHGCAVLMFPPCAAAAARPELDNAQPSVAPKVNLSVTKHGVRVPR
jgi:hypothetical protein